MVCLTVKMTDAKMTHEKQHKLEKVAISNAFPIRAALPPVVLGFVT